VTELIWEGKYRDGKRVAPVRIALPFQTVETVNESTRDRARTLDLFASGKPTEWRNRLIWGDKKYILPSLLPEFAGKVNLIYIDPPFDTGADFSFTTTVPESDEEITKAPSMIEQKAYRDTWGRGLDSYLQWFYDAAVLLRELLADNGSLYVHLDENVVHYAKAVLDEIFGSDMFRTQIIWKRSTAHSDARQGRMQHGQIHDVILFYAKSESWSWNPQYTPYDDDYVHHFYKHVEVGTGRRYQLDNLTGPGGAAKGNPQYEVMGVTRYWRYSKAKMDGLIREGRVLQTSPGTVPRYVRYLDEMPGLPLQDIWTDISVLSSQAHERLGYPTQKPEALLERIIKASSNAGELVLDCFSGSGTTPAVAEKLGRRWIACDLGRFAIHTARKRLLGIPGVKPFTVQNLGKYERQAWMAAEFEKPEDRAATENAYRLFILDLYRAEPISGHAWLHGVKSGRFVHVGAVDSPVTLADVKAIAREVWRTAGKTKNGNGHTAAVDILGWEFAFELNEMAKQTAAEARVDVRFKSIPRDVLDKKAIDQGDVQAKDFFELRVFSTKSSVKKRLASVELVDFMMPAEDLPEDVRKSVKHWSQWIDYWAIDWNFKNDTFHNEWQSYRTREEPKLKLDVQHEYKEPGTYAVVVKVIDLLGCDTTKMISLEVK
jgi:adenine-specific DNA-methyltransferase